MYFDLLFLFEKSSLFSPRGEYHPVTFTLALSAAGGGYVATGGANTTRENKRFFLLTGHISVTSIHIAFAKSFVFGL